MSDKELTRHDQVLLGLVFNLQAGAMAQLGKIQNPVTGEMEKDLNQARATIDVLEMLKVKCRTDTPEDILKMLDGAVMDLQLNYMDEMKKAAAAVDQEPAAEPDAEEPQAETAADDPEVAG